VPANRHFVVVCSANTRTHSGRICGTRDARRRLASSFDTSVTRLVDTLTREIPRKETTSVATVGEILTLPKERGCRRAVGRLAGRYELTSGAIEVRQILTWTIPRSPSAAFTPQVLPCRGLAISAYREWTDRWFNFKGSNEDRGP
jgi:hypothetical protein